MDKHRRERSRPPPLRVALIVGPNSAGKTTLARAIAAATSADTLELGDVVREHIRSDASLGSDTCEAYQQLIDRHGPDLATRWVLERASRVRSAALLVCGLRDLTSFLHIKRAIPDLLVVAVEAPSILRMRRDATKRPDCGREAFESRDARHQDWGLDTIMRGADILVQNDGELSKLEAAAIAVGARLISAALHETEN